MLLEKLVSSFTPKQMSSPPHPEVFLPPPSFVCMCSSATEVKTESFICSPLGPPDLERLFGFHAMPTNGTDPDARAAL